MDTSIEIHHCPEPHNVVTYVAPLMVSPLASHLLEDPERALAENAIWWFLENPSFGKRDRDKLQAVFNRVGWNMFVWKYYLVARCYLGGYKALSACLMLRRVH